jgi:hypothetical protein
MLGKDAAQRTKNQKQSSKTGSARFIQGNRK